MNKKLLRSANKDFCWLFPTKNEEIQWVSDRRLSLMNVESAMKGGGEEATCIFILSLATKLVVVRVKI